MRIRGKVAAVVLVGMVAAGVATAIYLSGSSGANGVFTPSGPVLRCPHTVELGEADAGDTLTGTFEVHNPGSQPLEIGNVRTACACIGLQRRTAGGLETVNTTAVAPGETGQFVLRFTAVGPPGQPMRVGVLFTTNDPENPEFGVQMLVSRLRGGVTTYPAQVLLNGVSSARPITRRLDVYDSNDTPRAIKGVRLSGLDQSKCVFAPPDPKAAVEPQPLGRLIGHLDLTLAFDGPGAVMGRVELETDEAPPRVIKVSVSGEVVNLVRIAPSALVLPVRRSGEWAYSARCACRSAEGGALKLTLTEVPEALDVTLSPATDDGPTYLEIALKPAFRSAKTAETYRVKVRGAVSDRTCELDVPVSVSVPD